MTAIVDRAQRTPANRSEAPGKPNERTRGHDKPAVPAVLYRVDEAAEALRLSRSSIYELIRSGQLRTIKRGSRRLVPVAALDDFVRSLERRAS